MLLAKKWYDLEHLNNPTRAQHTWKDVTTNEFDAYLDVLLLSGVIHSGYVHTKDLWENKPFYSF